MFRKLILFWMENKSNKKHFNTKKELIEKINPRKSKNQ
jgi:hypothetical protein